jgi:hypothetical protein
MGFRWKNLGVHVALRPVDQLLWSTFEGDLSNVSNYLNVCSIILNAYRIDSEVYRIIEPALKKLPSNPVAPLENTHLETKRSNEGKPESERARRANEDSGLPLYFAG